MFYVNSVVWYFINGWVPLLRSFLPSRRLAVVAVVAVVGLMTNNQCTLLSSSCLMYVGHKTNIGEDQHRRKAKASLVKAAPPNTEQSCKDT